jgi:hypothetical protein
LPRVALNRDPPDLCLLSGWDYRREPPGASVLGLCILSFGLRVSGGREGKGTSRVPSGVSLVAVRRRWPPWRVHRCPLLFPPHWAVIAEALRCKSLFWEIGLSTECRTFHRRVTANLSLWTGQSQRLPIQQSRSSPAVTPSCIWVFQPSLCPENSHPLKPLCADGHGDSGSRPLRTAHRVPCMGCPAGCT